MDTEISKYIQPGLQDQPFPLPRPRSPREVPLLRKKPANRQVESLFKNHSKLEILNQKTGFQGGPQPKRKGHHLALWSWLASFIDTLILISISCLFMLVFSVVIRHTTFIGNSAAGIHLLKRIFLAVFLMCSWVYMVILRVLMGSSVGEWACDLRLGQPHERLKTQYPVKVVVRESLILATGLITLPLASLLFGQDLAGELSGVKLFSLK